MNYINLEENQVNYCKNGKLDEFKKSVIDYGINYLNLDGFNDYLLECASENNHLNLVIYILKSIDIRDIRPALIKSLERGHDKIFDYLYNTRLENIDESIYNYNINNKMIDLLINKYRIYPLELKKSAVKYIIEWWRHHSSKPGSKIYYQASKDYHNVLKNF